MGTLTELDRARAYRDGDRVRSITHTWSAVPMGSVGRVIKPAEHPTLLGVSFDHDPIGDGTGSWSMMYHQIEHTSLCKHLGTVVYEHALYNGWYAQGRQVVADAQERIDAIRAAATKAGENFVWRVIELIAEKMDPMDDWIVADTWDDDDWDDL